MNTRKVALGGIAAGVVLVVLASGLIIRDSQEDLMPDPAGRTQLKLTLLQKRIGSAGVVAGKLPLSLNDLKLSTGRDSGLLYDVWGNAIKYTPRDTVFELRSAGADGAYETGDDIIVMGRLPTSK